MASNLVAKNTRIIGVNVDSKMADELASQAASMRISTTKYCSLVLQQWMDSGEILNPGKE